MKKLLVFLVMVAMLGMFGMIGAVADTQVVNGTVPGFVNFTLVTTSLNYGSVIPGAQSDAMATILRVNENNNVNFSIDVTLTDDLSLLFRNIYLEDIGTPGQYNTPLGFNSSISRAVADNLAGVAFDFNINSVLKVPVSFSPVSNAQGTVTYTVTGSNP